MRPAKSRPYWILTCSALVLPLLWSAPAARAGGGYSEPSLVEQSKARTTAEHSARGASVAEDSVTIIAAGAGFSFTATTGGIAGATPLAVAATVWDTTTVNTAVEADVTVDSNAITHTIAKGRNSISKGRSATQVTIVINGKKYAVAREVAIAIARATQFGTSAAVEVEGTLWTRSSGYSAIPVASSKGSR